ncbi:ABC transporter ATP-binding protein [Microlunatus elymi]|uniref:ABC transporter ATP-binding protein n=1 Tax=Microlunatus elymi TaxID=2596828 RepID=A0A516PZE3_9ACTN|nr:ABC transporter ATP-binding protein [Microlunatus elymi]QDP96522.1 ABC transporter ATP-binding protein [Microlunatus elymi]
MTEKTPILSVQDLVVRYSTGSHTHVDAVRGVTFDLYPGQSLALVGESGCGKTTLGLGLLRLLPRMGSVPSGSMQYVGKNGKKIDVLKLSHGALRRWRWEEAAIVFQGAMNSFNPVMRIGDQMADTMRSHLVGGVKPSKSVIAEKSAEMLRAVRLEPKQVLSSYPHELSGGMRQRVLIAISLLLDPRLLILDEPTTALDILTQRAIVDVLAELRERLGFTMIFITHDLALAAELADRVATMYAGRIIETGSVRDIFSNARHPYTAGLINAVPPVTGELPTLASIPGSPPSLASLPAGCAFRDRCRFAEEQCAKTDPVLDLIEQRPEGMQHSAACLRWQEVHSKREVVGADV